jgi:hypothetical protein
VRVDSLNANYSFKYFGKEQGVAAYTFRDERDLLWYSTIFSAAERESAYVIDGLMHNEVVKSDIHSTDAFGFSELVFAVSHLLGFSYAPRFKNLPRQRLYILRNTGYQLPGELAGLASLQSLDLSGCERRESKLANAVPFNLDLCCWLIFVGDGSGPGRERSQQLTKLKRPQPASFHETACRML